MSSSNQAPMLNKHRKRSRVAFTPFTGCPCCDGSTPVGRAREKREWRREADER